MFAGTSRRPTGKERALHLAGEHDFQAMPRAFVAEDVQLVLRLINGDEERQALDVVPMRVGQQQASASSGWLSNSAASCWPKQAHAGAGIENDDLAVRAHLDAGRIAAIAHRGRPRRRNRAAHAPELQPSRSRRQRHRRGMPLGRRLSPSGDHGKAAEGIAPARSGLVMYSSAPRLEGSLPVALELPARGNDDLRLAQRVVAAQRAADLESIAPGHHQVAQNDGRLLQFGRSIPALPSSASITCHPCGSQQLTQDLAVVGVVVNDENGLHERRVCGGYIARTLGELKPKKKGLNGPQALLTFADEH